MASRDPSPFALIYECKSRADGYNMSSDDVLRYKEYIKSKRHEIQVKYHLRLTHFVIVSSEFRGDFMPKVEDIEADGTVVSLLTSSALTFFYDKVRELDFADLHLLNLRRIFCRGLIVNGHLESCLG